MKYPRQVSMPSGIQLWLEEQLHARGIDAAVYSKYILSVLSNENSRNSIKPKDNDVAILVEELSAKLKKVQEKGQFPFTNPSPAKNFEDLSSQSAQEKSSRFQSAIPPSSSKSKSDISSSFGSSSGGIWSGKRTFGSSVGKNRTNSEGNNKEGKLNQNNFNWLEEDKENNHFTRDAKEKIRSRSTVKQQTPDKARSRNMAKSLDRKEDFDNKSEMSKSRRLFQSSESSDLTSEKVKALWSTEKSFDDLTGCDQDLPMDFQQLLESPEATKMSVDTSRCPVSKQPSSFIQCGTNITSSIWSEKAEESMDCSMIGEISGDLNMSFNKSVWGLPASEDALNRNEMLQESLGSFKSMGLWGHGESRMFDLDSWKTVGSKEKESSADFVKWSDVEGTRMLLNDADNFFSSIGSDLRGSLTTLNHNKEDSSFTEVIPKVSNVGMSFGANKSNVEPQVNKNPSPKKEEEDLLISMKTHFRPIKQETVETAAPTAAPTYPDGTTFPISNSLDKPNFHRSPGGGLYLDSDMNKKYMEFNDTEDRTPSEFVPKFRVSQNEKFCQTEDFALSPQQYEESDCEELYFPDDEKLVRSMVEEDEEDVEEEEENVFWGGEACIKVDGWMATWPAAGIWSNEANVQPILCGANVWNAGEAAAMPQNDGGGEQYMRLRNEWTQEAEELFSDISHHLMANYTDTQPPKLVEVETKANEPVVTLQGLSRERKRRHWSSQLGCPPPPSLARSRPLTL